MSKTEHFQRPAPGPGRFADEEGQALVEYALILLLVALVAVAGLTAIGTSVSGIISNLAGAF